LSAERRLAAVQSPLACAAPSIQRALGFSLRGCALDAEEEPIEEEMELAVVRSQQGRRGARGLRRAVKEHGARLRIICRCVALLVFYRD